MVAFSEGVIALLKQLEFEFRRVIKVGFLLLFLGSVLTAIRDGNAATDAQPFSFDSYCVKDSFCKIGGLRSLQDLTIDVMAD